MTHPLFPNRRWQRAFTLIELLAAMAVFSLVMVMLFSFFASAQRAWTATEANTRIFENARIVFDVVARDLQSAVASAEAGREIPFYVGVDADKLLFVSQVECTTTSTANLAEVGFRWGGATGVNAHALQRSRICEHNAVAGWDNDWNFYGRTPANNPAPAWEDNPAASYSTMVKGVEAIAFGCLGRDGTVWALNSQHNELPAVVMVSVTLFDENLSQAPAVVRDRTKRTFTKVIFLGGRN